MYNRVYCQNKYGKPILFNLFVSVNMELILYIIADMIDETKIYQENKRFYENLCYSVSSRNQSLENIAFQSITSIPNKLKTNIRERSLSVHKYTSAKRSTIRDFIKYHPRGHQPGKISIHTTLTPISIRANKKDYDILPNSTMSIYLKKDAIQMSYDEYFQNILISISNIPCTIGIEVFYREKVQFLRTLPSNPIQAQIPMPTNALSGFISFTREDRKPQEWLKDTIIIDVKIGVDHNFQPHPTTVVVMTPEGQILFHSKITPRKCIREYYQQETLVNDEKLRNQMDEEEAVTKLYSLWRNKLIVGHNLKSRLSSIQVRLDEVLGVRDLVGAKEVIKRTKSISRNWSDNNKLENIYYQIFGRTMRKGKSLDNINAIREIYEELHVIWEDHYCIENSDEEIRLPNNKNDKNLLQWVDEQSLSEQIVIQDVKTNTMWKLIPLEIEAKNDMASRMNYDFQMNRFKETGEPFCVRNYEPIDDKCWYDKLIGDLCKDMDSGKDIRDVIMQSPSEEETNIFNSLDFNLSTLDIDDVDRLLEEMEQEDYPQPNNDHYETLLHKTKKPKKPKNKKIPNNISCHTSMTIKFNGKKLTINDEPQPSTSNCTNTRKRRGKDLNLFNSIYNAHIDLTESDHSDHSQLSPIPTPTPKVKVSKLWSVDLDLDLSDDQDLIDAGTHLPCPPK